MNAMKHVRPVCEKSSNEFYLSGYIFIRLMSRVNRADVAHVHRAHRMNAFNALVGDGYAMRSMDQAVTLYISFNTFEYIINSY